MTCLLRPGSANRLGRVALGAPIVPLCNPTAFQGRANLPPLVRSGVARRQSSVAHATSPALSETEPHQPYTPLFLPQPTIRELEARYGGPKEGDTIVVAVSGGIDSSTTLARLCLGPSDIDPSRPKYEVHVVFMRNWNSLDEGDNFEPGASGGGDGCEWVQDWKDVQAVTAHLRQAMKRTFPHFTPHLAQDPVIRSHSRPPQFPTTIPPRADKDTSSLLPIHFIDLTRQYWTDVFEPALELWEAGQTPNPDVSCNRSIKFGALIQELFGQSSSASPSAPAATYLERRAALGKTWLATGHYAGVRWDRDQLGQPRPRLIRSSDPSKDQTYYMSSIHQDALRYVVFPLSEMRKTDVKQLARDLGLPTADRAESMGLCFVGERQKKSSADQVPSRTGLAERLAGFVAPVTYNQSYIAGNEPFDPRIPANRSVPQVPRTGVSLAGHFATFVANYLPAQASAPGKLVHLESGEVLGEHSGLHTLTLGQKARIGGRPQKTYVVWKGHVLNVQRQEKEAVIYVVDGHSHPALMCEQVYIPKARFDWIGLPPPGADSPEGQHVQTQIRHRQDPLPGTIRTVSSLPPSAFPASPGVRTGSTEWYQVTFDQPIAGVAPGQVVALWDQEGATLGSGTIHNVYTAWDRQRAAS